MDIYTFGPFYIDKTGPIIQYQGKSEYKVGEKFNINFTAEDELSGISSTEIYINGSDIKGDSYIFEKPGKYELRIISHDNAGNSTEITKELNLLLPISVHIDPAILNLKNAQKGKSVITVDLVIPDGYDPSDIIANSISINGCVYSESNEKYGYVKNPIHYDKMGKALYTVKFYRSDLAKILNAGDNQVYLRGKTQEYDVVWEGTIKVK